MSNVRFDLACFATMETPSVPLSSKAALHRWSHVSGGFVNTEERLAFAVGGGAEPPQPGWRSPDGDHPQAEHSVV